MSWQPLNPYAKQMCLFVSTAEHDALGQFMRDFGDDLEGFVDGEDLEMRAVSADGQGPPDGRVFCSFVTLLQGDAFFAHEELPASTVVSDWDVGTSSPAEFMAALVPPMIFIEED